uniref:Bm7709, isoform b n=1 Tax=Brugia malayi TaxID=6279 RepID=A0A1I9FZJ4_BRUMA|nr:Bm7709, isoform b [Brugia malayi]
MCRRRTMDGQALRVVPFLCRRDGFIWWGGKECVVDFLLDSLCPKSQITHYFARTKARCNHSPFRSRRDPSGNSVNRIPSLHMSKNAVYLLFWPYLLICHITVNHSTWLTNTCSERVFVFTSVRECYVYISINAQTYICMRVCVCVCVCGPIGQAYYGG